MLRIHDILVWFRIRIGIRGSMTLTNGSGFGSGSGCGSGSCYLRHWPLRCQQKTNFFKKVFCLLLFEGIYIIFKDKKSQSSRNQSFSYYFCLVIEGSGSGSTPLSNGSASGLRRPKNMWIRWIRVRIRNTDRGMSWEGLWQERQQKGVVIFVAS